jgi:hypothetical protein
VLKELLKPALKAEKTGTDAASKKAVDNVLGNQQALVDASLANFKSVGADATSSKEVIAKAKATFDKETKKFNFMGAYVKKARDRNAKALAKAKVLAEKNA